MACYYAQRDHIGLAFTQLDYAFEARELLPYAEKDPSLAPLRKRLHRERWEKLRQRHGAEPAADPLAQWWMKKN